MKHLVDRRVIDNSLRCYSVVPKLIGPLLPSEQELMNLNTGLEMTEESGIHGVPRQFVYGYGMMMC